jgi:hypothetical protein
MSALGITIGDLRAAYQANDGSLDHLNARIVAWINRSESASGRTHAVGAAFKAMSNNALTADQRVQGLTDALDGMIDPRVNLSQLTDQWNTSIRHLDDNLAKDRGHLLANTDAASKNRDVIRGMVENLKQRVEAEAKLHPTSTRLLADLERQRNALIEAGTAAGLSRAQLQTYLKELGLTPHDIRTNFHLDGTQQSLSQIRAVRNALAQLHDRTIVLTTTRVNTTGGHSVAGNADGGTIPGPRYPYGDKVLRYVAPGEEVISNRNGQADRWRPVLKRINAGGMADGGTVSTYSSSLDTMGSSRLGGITFELRRLKAALHDSSKELDAERQHRQALAQQRQSLVSTVRDNFRSDIFGVTPDNGIWSAGAGQSTNPLRILHQDIRHAREFRTDIRQLRHRGLHGAALAQVTTLGDAQQAEGLSNKELRQISRLYGIRQRASQAAGASLGDAIYGKRLDESNAHLDKIKHHTQMLRQDVHHLTAEVKHLKAEQAKNAKAAGKATGAAINKSASTATRRARASS